MQLRIRNRILILGLSFIAFAAGFFVPTASACTRVNATCSYQVTGYVCLYSSCGFCDRYGMPCCYKEMGYCLDDPGKQTYSQICYGLCQL